MKTLARWLAGIALLAAALWLLDWPRLAEAAARLTPGAVAAAVLLACTTFAPLAARWHLLSGGGRAGTARYLYANLANAVSPGNIGGDVYRFFALRGGRTGDLALVAILVRERLLGLASMLAGLALGVAAMELAGAGSASWRALGAAAVLGLAGMGLLPSLIRRIPLPGNWNERLREAIEDGTARGNAGPLALSLAALALWLAVVQFAALRLGIEIPWYTLLAVATAAEIARAVPATVQGIGVREAAYAALFGLSGYSPESGFVLGAVAYLALGAALVASGALGAVLLALAKR